MEPSAALDLAAAEFATRLRLVTSEDWARPTPCTDLDVRALCHHVVGGNLMAARLFAGASAAESLEPLRTDSLGEHPVEAFDAAQRELVTAMHRPGALDGIVHHAMGDIPATRLVEFRIADLALHGWDLARAIGAPEALPAELVALLWAQISPMAPMIDQIGIFGTGPSGNIGEDAPLQTRLLDLTGRRP